jgi:hypothetical protein
MSIIGLQHERDLAAARAEFMRQGGTKAQWLEILSSLEEAARRFFEKHPKQTSARKVFSSEREYPTCVPTRLFWLPRP